MQKNGERAGSPLSGGVRDGQGAVAAAGVHADRSGTIRVELSIDEGHEGCAGAQRMAELSAQYPRYGYRRIAIFLGRDGLQDELWPCAAAVASGEAAGAEEAAAQAHCERPARRPNAPTGANQVWSYDFVFDWCAQRSAAEVPDRDGRVDEGGLAIEVDGRIRSGRVIDVLSRLVSRAWCAALSSFRQWAGIRPSRAPEMDCRERHRNGIDRPGQALAEWIDRELQRQIPRRVPVVGVVPLADRGEGGDRDVAAAL